MGMFCYQCEQTAKGSGCTVQGVCGKNPETAYLQDLLVNETKKLAFYSHGLRQFKIKDRETDVFVLESLFSTVTNVNFDPERIKSLLDKCTVLTNKARTRYNEAAKQKGATPEDAGSLPIGINERKKLFGEDITGMEELLLYGLKGTAAYADHAHILGQEDDIVYAFFHEALSYLTTNKPSADVLVPMILRCGEINLRAMELLDAGNTGTYGHPEPTAVPITHKKGKAILVSGHDLKDLEEILKQTEGKGINVYTHGEMLPCHGYPKLKKYKHLAGNYGGAWQDQHMEFDAFPGSIIMTTNCIQKPRDSYRNRIFTSGLVAWPGVHHIMDRNFAPAIEVALANSGFTDDEPQKTIMVGFGHNTVMSVADKIIDAVKSGAIKHFFLVGGCDGAKPGRNYYTEFAEKVPEDCMILTLACGKYRFNKKSFGNIGGIPRLLDIGQCNDAYSAIQIAIALSKAFNCSVNDLPLSLILSWYEQKAVCILLTLLHLGIKNIRLGPSLPAFVSPNTLNFLIEKFNIRPITTPDEDLKTILG